jgi:hypothetical protein
MIHTLLLAALLAAPPRVLVTPESPAPAVLGWVALRAAVRRFERDQ